MSSANNSRFTSSDSSRPALAERIRHVIKTRPPGRESEHRARVEVLGAMLHPDADVVGGAIRHYEKGSAAFPDVEREKIADYITRTFENRIVGTGESDAPRLSLDELLNRSHSPFAWGDQFARRCVGSGVKDVTRARNRAVFADIADLEDLGSLPMAEHHLSAEESYLRRERNGRAEVIADVLEQRARPRMGAFEATRLKAGALQELLRIPAPLVTDTEHRRWLSSFAKRDDLVAQARQSLAAHRDLITGDPQWEQLEIDDRLLDLWTEFTAERAEALMASRDQIVALMVKDAGIFPPRPKDAHRTGIRHRLRGMSTTRGWGKLVMRLEQAWSAEFFDARNEHNNSDKRPYDVAEADRVTEAADWVDAAREALMFDGRPLRARSIEQVADRIFGLYDEVSAPTSMPDSTDTREHRAA